MKPGAIDWCGWKCLFMLLLLVLLVGMGYLVSFELSPGECGRAYEKLSERLIRSAFEADDFGVPSFSELWDDDMGSKNSFAASGGHDKIKISDYVYFYTPEVGEMSDGQEVSESPGMFASSSVDGQISVHDPNHRYEINPEPGIGANEDGSENEQTLDEIVMEIQTEIDSSDGDKANAREANSTIWLHREAISEPNITSSPDRKPQPTTMDEDQSSDASERSSKLNSSTACFGKKDSDTLIRWTCQGLHLVRAPRKLDPPPIGLRLHEMGIVELNRETFINYRDTLRDISIDIAPELVSIKPDTFGPLIKLRSIQISKAPKLVSLNGSLPELNVIRIRETGLSSWPDMSSLRQGRILTSVDMSNNQISNLGEKPVGIRTELLNIGHNKISTIQDFIFNGSEIGVLLLNGNSELDSIHSNAFNGLKNLVKINLSGTKITQLPSRGMHEVRSLIIQQVFTLKKVPSIFYFPKLERAQLSYPHHCCAFKFPKAHDPGVYEEFMKIQKEIDEICAMHRSQATTTSVPQSLVQDSEFEGNFGPILKEPDALPVGDAISLEDYLKSRIGGKLWMSRNIRCGRMRSKYTAIRNISCTPEPNALNPCEDIMGNSVLRVSICVIVVAALIGNLLVIVVILTIIRRITVPKFLLLNLAISDLIMALYMGLLAIADLLTFGAYFNYAMAWQEGIGCKLAGAACIFASQLSIFNLSVLTLERYFTIAYSIDLNMRLNLAWAFRVIVLGWLLALVSATLPIFAGINSYSLTSICVPVRTATFADKLYLYVLLTVDSIAFLIILACYLKMYLIISRQGTEATAKERKIAKRMALLVITDFLCWAPVIFFGFAALAGHPLISVTNAKFLMVFFFPLNCLVNPFIYVLSTHQFKRDLNYLRMRVSDWRWRLLHRNQDRYSYHYYSYMMHQSGNLNARLGAVASITRAARHLRHQRPRESEEYEMATRGGSLTRLEEEQPRYICTIPHKGDYVIRHEIMTERRSPIEGRDRGPESVLAAAAARARLSIRQQPDGIGSSGQSQVTPDASTSAKVLSLPVPEYWGSNQSTTKRACELLEEEGNSRGKNECSIEVYKKRTSCCRYCQVCEGLVCMHEENRAHRIARPDNENQEAETSFSSYSRSAIRLNKPPIQQVVVNMNGVNSLANSTKTTKTTIEAQLQNGRCFSLKKDASRDSIGSCSLAGLIVSDNEGSINQFEQASSCSCSSCSLGSILESADQPEVTVNKKGVKRFGRHNQRQSHKHSERADLTDDRTCLMRRDCDPDEEQNATPTSDHTQANGMKVEEGERKSESILASSTSLPNGETYEEPRRCLQRASSLDEEAYFETTENIDEPEK